jgi:hypothetical protein
MRNSAVFFERYPASTTAGIQEAIDDLPATGGIVFLPAGTHTISASIEVYEKPVTLLGAGHGTTIIQFTTGPAIHFYSDTTSASRTKTRGCGICNLRITGLPGNSGVGLYLDHLQWFHASNVLIRDLTSTGLKIESLWDCYIEDTSVQKCGDVANPGILIQGSEHGTADGDCNDLILVRLHGEDSKGIQWEFRQGNPATHATAAINLFGCKAHGRQDALQAAQPIVKIGVGVNECLWSGGLIALGDGVSQVEVGGTYWIFDGVRHGGETPGKSVAYIYDFVGTGRDNQVRSVRWNPGTTGLVSFARFQAGAADNEILFPKSAQLGAVTIKTDVGLRNSVIRRERGKAGLMISDSIDRVVLTPPTELTISAGAVTVTQSYHVIDTEGDAATDDLDTINGGVDGMRLILRSADSARDPTLKDLTGNLNLVGDFTLAFCQRRVELLYDAEIGKWVELSRSAP